MGAASGSPNRIDFTPFTTSWDYIARDDQYHPDHRYLSYSGSRVVGRSDMPLGYQGIASIFSIVLDTAYLPLTGLIDLIYVIWFEDVPGEGEADGDDEG